MTNVATNYQNKTRNLVVVRAGNGSLHRNWLEGAKNGFYDIVVSYYGDRHRRYELPIENKIYIKGGKWDGLYETFRRRPFLLENYDYFFLPDDDILASSKDVIHVFGVAQSMGLDVCQPSLSHDSYFSHLVYLQCPSFRLRYSSAVEIMVPCLSQRTLRAVLPLFATTKTGFGLDGLWTRLQLNNLNLAAIIDSVAVRHTRPVGGSLHKSLKSAGGISGNQERIKLYNALNVNLDGIKIYGAIMSDGSDTRSRLSIMRAIYKDLKGARRNAVQKQYWYHELARLMCRQAFMPVTFGQVNFPHIDAEYSA